MSATTTLPLDVDVVAQELKAIVQGIGRGTGSGFGYAQNVRRELSKPHNQTIRNIVAFLYDAITHRGCSASEATGWLHELIARCEEWEDHREGIRVGAPDILPLIRRENRFEAVENDLTTVALYARDTDGEADALRKAIAAKEAEVEAEKLAIAVMRDRLIAVDSQGARETPPAKVRGQSGLPSRQLAGAR